MRHTHDDGRPDVSLFTRLTSASRPGRGRLGVAIAAIVIIAMLIGALALLPVF